MAGEPEGVDLELAKEKVKEYLGLEDLPYWCSERIKDWNEPFYKGFSREELTRTFSYRVVEDFTAEITPEEVKGTYHSDYAGRPWWYMILAGKRIDSHFEGSRDVDKYAESLKGMRYARISGEDIFVVGDGNHRTFVAKLMGLKVLRGVFLTTYFVDFELADAVNSLKEIIMKFFPSDTAFSIEVVRRQENRRKTVTGEVIDYTLATLITIDGKYRKYGIHQKCMSRDTTVWLSERLRKLCNLYLKLLPEFLYKKLIRRCILQTISSLSSKNTMKHS